MGVAGVAILFGLYYGFKSIVSLIQFFAWSKLELSGARLGPVLRSETVKKEKKTVNELYVGTSAGTVTTEFAQVSKASELPELNEGDTLEGYYNPQKNQFRSKKELTQALWMNPAMCLFCIVIVIACFFLAGSIR